MMTNGTSLSSTLERSSDREIVMTRVFDAPTERVYRAYTDPVAIEQWWGLRNTTTTVETSDVTPGGAWRYIQRDQEGNEYAFRGEYREVVPNRRLVNSFEFEPMPGHIVIDATTFEDVDGKTRVTVTSLFDSREDLDGMLESGMEAGANESWDRLAEYLAANSQAEDSGRPEAENREETERCA